MADICPTSTWKPSEKAPDGLIAKGVGGLPTRLSAEHTALIVQAARRTGSDLIERRKFE